MRLFKDPRETHPRSCRTNHRSITPTGAGRPSTREEGRKSGLFADARHREYLFVSEGRSCVCRSHSSLRHFMTSRPHLKVSAIASCNTTNNKPSSLRRLKNSVPQGFVLAPLLFNIYASDLPTNRLQKVCIG